MGKRHLPTIEALTDKDDEPDWLTLLELGSLITITEMGEDGVVPALSVTNAFNERFDSVLEGLSIDTLIPRRRALLSLTWRLW